MITAVVNIQETLDWLQRLKDAAGAIQREGVRAGANQAASSGLRARQDGSTVHVDYRGRAPLDTVPGAMLKGMGDEFDRRAR